MLCYSSPKKQHTYDLSDHCPWQYHLHFCLSNKVCRQLYVHVSLRNLVESEINNVVPVPQG